MFDELTKEIVVIQRELLNTKLTQDRFVKSKHDEQVGIFLGMIDLLDLIENFASTPGNTVGLDKVKRRIEKLLKTCHVKAIEFEHGQPILDSKAAYVLSVRNSEISEGCVIELIRKGYRWGDYVLRPAQVVLSQGSSPTDSGNTFLV